MPDILQDCKPYTADELLFWFWLIYHHAKEPDRRKGIIVAARQADMMGETLAADLCRAFDLAEA